MRIRAAVFLLTIVLLVIGGCTRPWPASSLPVQTPTSGFFPTDRASSTPPQPPSNTPTIVPSDTPSPVPAIRAWVDPALQSTLTNALLSNGWQVVEQGEQADVRFTLGVDGLRIGDWVYALVAPFPTLEDGVTLADLKQTWRGDPVGGLSGHAILVDAATRAVFDSAWGAAGSDVRVLEANSLLDTAWQEKTSWAIIPFEAIQPRWKVLSVDGRSPFDRNLDLGAYGLDVPVVVVGSQGSLARVQQAGPLPFATPVSNRDPDKLTVLVMTGVTALVRGTAYFMEQNGLLFPGKDVRDWLLDADITHVSNEVSFDPDCPPPNPNDPNLRFCSDPKYIQLLEDVGVDVVEMTGNHLNDFGSQWVPYTIDLYKQHNWAYYGAGPNQEAARQPIFIENHGNRLAFIGCNPAGPPADWATDTQPGTADCAYPDMDYLVAMIQQLKKEGFLPIVTIQYFESYDPTPLPIHYRDFQRLSDAGAVIVSGSQAHLPQAMELRNNGFIHYGLGNLFFDQMETPWPDTRDEFIDRHVFYDGRYLGVTLLTARLEQYVKPRPMTTQERTQELTDIFSVSGWPPNSSKPWR